MRLTVCARRIRQPSRDDERADAQAASVVGPRQVPRAPRRRAVRALRRGPRSADNPILPVSEAINETLRNRSGGCSRSSGLELLRQIHYVDRRAQRGVLPVLAAASRGRWNHRVERHQPVDALPHRPRSSSGCSILIVLNAFVAWRSENRSSRQLVNLPRRVVDYLFDPIGELPFIFTLALQLVLTRRRSSAPCSGSCRRAASRPTSPTTSRRASPTCGARTPCSRR